MAEKPTPKQVNRMLAIETAAGAKLKLNEVTVHEQLGRLFHIEAQLSAADEVDLDEVIGKNATIRIQTGDSTERFFNGYVSRISEAPSDSGLGRFRAEIVPWLWFLTRRSDCRIFEKKTVKQILEEVFKSHGFDDFKFKLSETHPELETCVQYRETDFNFVSRLMEQEGIYYFTEHTNGTHTLVLADSISAHPKAEPGEVVYNVDMDEWTMDLEVQPVAYAHTDFDFKKPKTPLLAHADVTRPYGGNVLEIFDYPGEYRVVGDGTHLADVRLAELQSQHEVLHGQTTLSTLACGATFLLKGHPVERHNRDYLITSTVMHVAEGDYTSGGSGSEFSCHVTAIEKKQSFRTPRATPKPVVQGVQTAIVVGTDTEKEIHTDEFGRVRVRFHWIRPESKTQESCWVRVSQGWAGKQWGAIYIPRVGQEVIVSFLEGDPDQPIVTGRVYNAEAMPPYKLPVEKTKSTLKSNSTPDGGGFNEIRFEDKKDSEQVFIHGQKDMDLRVLNDSKEWVGHDRHLIVKNDQVELVENDRQEKIKRDHVEDIGRDRHTKITGKEAKEVVETLSIKVGKDVGIEIGENLNEKVKKDILIEAKNIVFKATDNITLKIGEDEIYLAMTKDGIKLSAAGKEIALDSKDINQKASGNFKAEASTNADLKAGAALKAEGGSSADLKSPATTVDGGATCTVKGGMVKIN